MEREKVMIAMSGGVDSSAAAYLMQQAGFDCQGAMMDLTGGAGDSIRAAGEVAEKLHIPFTVFPMQESFRRQVIDPFIRCYEQGGTPNPCVTCNRYLKFGLFLQKARSLGCRYVATGHYVKIRREQGRYLLYRADDEAKDQSYFLYSLTQEQLAHTLFPLSELSKDQVRQIADRQGFGNAHRKDSQDICFIPDGDYMSFLRSYRGTDYPQGDFLDLQGRIVGRHNGAPGYTLGQRRGLGLAMGEPVYVCGKDMERNTVTVGPEQALFHRALIADDWNFFPFPALASPITVTAKARYRHRAEQALATPLPDGSVRVEFEKPQRALTPGQAVVLYQGDLVIGGGTIRTIL